MFFLLFPVVFLSFLFPLAADDKPTQAIRPNLASDFRTQLYKDEGYLQAWNFSFQNQDYKVFLTFLVSNFGPGSKNNGMSVLVKHKNKDLYYSTQEFGEDEYSMKPGQFFQQSGENWMAFKEGKYVLHMVFPDWIFDLEFSPTLKSGIAISGGKLYLGDKERFIQADIPLSYANVKGYIFYKGLPEEVKGVGGMEHLLTNYEVYKFSKKWEIVRSQTKEGTRILAGGFMGSEIIPGGFFRKVGLISKSGEILLDGTVSKIEILETEKDLVSGYTLPKKEKLYLNERDDCHLTIERKQTIGSMSALENISALLRFFIGLFFTKPYQVHSDVEMSIHCGDFQQKAKGIHSYYLINE
ncbi:hypothetical protein LPTSP4_23820 [Leptospira ryugenii]|uniref:Svf1-like C-terminal domain-containing protein n=1 Tax=Leptospira ryugenii TaxID=1917863 RepID=A0A2P2E1T3_9LEPT|nr:hypothetical protein [Leptospira ryugenii]GBF50855.1 hypothetical protein LPTSP4_23820 [Leptospira ryugenii]